MKKEGKKKKSDKDIYCIERGVKEEEGQEI